MLSFVFFLFNLYSTQPDGLRQIAKYKATQSDGVGLTAKYKLAAVSDGDRQILFRQILISFSSNHNHTMLFPGLS